MKYDDMPTMAYLVMVNREDKTAPKLCKAVDKLHYTEEDAKLHLDKMNSDIARSFGVYEVEVKVARMVS